jgi:primosomal protein N' (replication factor Y)
MSAFAEVSINLSQIEKSYHYAIPEGMQSQLVPGSLVTVPFGKQIAQGVVLALLDEAEIAEPKEILEILSPNTVLVEGQLKLALWLAEHTFTPLGACIQLMIPTGLSRRADILVSGLDKPIIDREEFSKSQLQLLNLLKQRGELRGSQIDRSIPVADWRKGLDALRAKGMIRTSNVLPPPRVSSKMLRTAALSILPNALAEFDLASLGKNPTTQERRGKILSLLAKQAFPLDFSWIYAETGGNYADLSYLSEQCLNHFNETETRRDPL